MRRLVMVAVVVVVALAAIGAVSRPSVSGALGMVAEYGGSEAVYQQISVSTDCAELQTTFDRAAANNDSAQPASAEQRWTVGYMKAADERMAAIGCY